MKLMIVGFIISFLLFVPSFSYGLDDTLTKAADSGNLYEEAYKVARKTTDENYQQSLEVLGAQLGLDADDVESITKGEIYHCNNVFMGEHPECWDPIANDPYDMRPACENSTKAFYDECVSSVSSYVTNQTSLANNVSYMEHRIIGEDQYQNGDSNDSSFDLYKDIENIEKIMYKTPGDLPTDFKINESPKTEDNGFDEFQYTNVGAMPETTTNVSSGGGGGGSGGSGGSGGGGGNNMGQACFNTGVDLVFLDDETQQSSSGGGGGGGSGSSSGGGGGGGGGVSSLSKYIGGDGSTLASSSPWYNAEGFDSFVGGYSDNGETSSLNEGTFFDDEGSDSDGISSSGGGEMSCWGDDGQLLSICLSLVPATGPEMKGGGDIRVKSIEEIVDAINGVLTHTRQHFTVRHEYSDEFLEIRLKNLELSKILDFNIVLTEKSVFDQNTEENYKDIKEANKNDFEQSYNSFGITYDNNIDNEQERNKYNFDTYSTSLNNMPSNPTSIDAVESLKKNVNIDNEGGNSEALSSNTAKAGEATQKVIEERDRWVRQMQQTTETIRNILEAFKQDAQKMKQVSEQ